MTDPFAARLADLPAAERDEVEQLLADRPPARWVSDAGDGLVVHAILAVAAVAGIAAYLVEFSLAEYLEFWTWLPYTLPRALVSPEIGFTLALLAVPLLAWRLRVLHGRHGWMAASFGLVRVRGPKLRIARWSEVQRISRRRVGTGGRGFVVWSLTTPRGVLECDTGGLQDEIRRRAPSAACVDG
jgi:hypothetical protein